MTVEEFDTDAGIVDWGEPEPLFATIARQFLESGQGLSGEVGLAQSYLFDAAELVQFGVRWIEREFNVTSQGDVDQ